MTPGALREGRRQLRAGVVHVELRALSLRRRCGSRLPRRGRLLARGRAQRRCRAERQRRDRPVRDDHGRRHARRWPLRRRRQRQHDAACRDRRAVRHRRRRLVGTHRRGRGFRARQPGCNGRQEGRPDPGQPNTIGQLVALRPSAQGPPATDTVPPTPPTDLQVTATTASSVSVGWTASQDDTGVSGYGLYRGGSPTGSSATTSATFAGLACGQSYTLAVDAYDAAGNRSSQASLSASTSACAPPPPPPPPASAPAPSASRLRLRPRLLRLRRPRLRHLRPRHLPAAPADRVSDAPDTAAARLLHGHRDLDHPSDARRRHLRLRRNRDLAG